MKIKLIENIPIDDMYKGRVFDVLKTERNGWVWVQGNDDRILIKKSEYEIIKEEDNGTLG